jgi:hypothetical protein
MYNNNVKEVFVVFYAATICDSGSHKILINIIYSEIE